MATDTRIGEVARKIEQIAMRKMAKALRESKVAVKDIASKTLKSELFASEFWNKVTKSSAFRGELGLENPYNKAAVIVNHVAEDNFKLTLKNDPGPKQRLTISLGELNYEKLFRLPEASQQNNSTAAGDERFRKALGLNTGPKGRDRVLTQIPWLKWVLTKGQNIVVHRWHLVKGVAVGRSGLRYIMRRNPTPTIGKKVRYKLKPREDGYSVSKEFSGFPGNNMLIRSIKRARPKVRKALITEGLKVIRANIRANR